MQAKKILFPTDFSTTSDAALAYASSLARDTGATLLIAHVEEPPMVYGAGHFYYGIPDPDQEAMTEMLEKLEPTVPDVPHTHHMLTGAPADAILRLAKEEGVDFIVMGTHGRTGLSRLLMGSIAEDVVRRAPCPVLTFRHPETQSPESA